MIQKMIDVPANQDALFGAFGRQPGAPLCGRKSPSQKYWSKRLRASSRRDISRISFRFFEVAPSMSAKYSISFDLTERMLEPSPDCLMAEMRIEQLVCRIRGDSAAPTISLWFAHWGRHTGFRRVTGLIQGNRV
jgi:hypothetical protein